MELNKGVFVIHFSTTATSQPHVAAPPVPAQQECTTAAATFSQTEGECTSGAVEVAASEEAVTAEIPIAAEPVLSQLPCKKGPADYVTVEWTHDGADGAE